MRRQVIYIGDAKMVNDMRRREYGYHHTITQAIGAAQFPKTNDCHGPTPEGVCDHEEVPPTAEQPGGKDLAAVEAAETAMIDGDFTQAAALYQAAITENCPTCRSPHSRKWRLATLWKAKAEAQRRNRDFPQALDSLVQATQLFPRYKEGLMARGRTLVDAGKSGVALKIFEQLLRLDRAYPDVLTWLTRANANVRRAEEAAKKSRETAGAIGAGPSEASEAEKAAEASLVEAIRRTGYNSPPTVPAPVDHYARLGLCHDFTPAELKKRYKKASMAAHPDRAGGSTEAFEAVAAAYEVLGDEARRAAYDVGDDIPREIQSWDGQEGPAHATKVERTYFPDNFGFEPFGDPFEHKREMEAEKKRSAPPVPNAEDTPAGSYKDSCNGCAMDGEQKRLTCTQCKHWSAQARNWDITESTIKVAVCTPEEWIGNRDGVLSCETKPQTVLDEDRALAGDVAPDLDAVPLDGEEEEAAKSEL